MMETWKATRTYLGVWSYSNKTHKDQLKTKKQSDRKAFLRLMLQGQVKKALKFWDTANGIDGKYNIIGESQTSCKKSIQKQ